MRTAGWLNKQFEGKPGVHYSAKRSVEKYASRGKLFEMVKAHKWHLIETDTHYIVICDTGFLRFWC
jgi:hypothetical protein